MQNVSTMESAKEVWETLEDMYKYRGSTRKVMLGKELPSLKKSEAESMAIHT